MSHWHGNAPNYSRAVERASNSVRGAEKRLMESLEEEYPLDAIVRVVHNRGEFYARVIGWDQYGTMVHVCNLNTGKSSKWWAAHVELADPEDGTRVHLVTDAEG